jgi:amidase
MSTRREFVLSGVAAGASTLFRERHRVPQESSTVSDDFALAEATVADLQAGMQSGRWTARSIAEQYLARIDQLDKQGPAIRAVIETNPDALRIAEGLDDERRAKGPRGPLHGVPVLIKDNIATADRMQTTAGSLALVGSLVPRDAFLVTRLRTAGAVILGKTNLSEWANFRSTHSSSGWSGRGGQTRNPYALDRSPSGSSSGSAAAAAANLCALTVGTETDGSILSPSSCCGLVGVKPTIGLVSRAGIVPISHNQDTAGPIVRTVRDAATLLTVLAGVDPRDKATKPKGVDYTAALDPQALRGARIGVARKHYFGYSYVTDKIMDDAIDTMRRLGAVIIDPADIETAGKWDDAELEVLLCDFKADLNAYLFDLGPGALVRTLADVIAFNEAHQDTEMPYFRQEQMVAAQAKGPLTSPKYVAALAKCHLLTRTEGIDQTMTMHRLDAIVAPTNGPAWVIDLVDGDGGGGGSSTSPTAVAGYPAVTVPAGYAFGLPVGMSFMGRSFSETRLLALAYAFEQETKVRQQPAFKTTAVV